jgi:hypothetical protein
LQDFRDERRTNISERLLGAARRGGADARLLYVLRAPGVVAFLAARVPKEEQMMLEQFGDEYRDYMKRTGRYLPPLRTALRDRE